MEWQQNVRNEKIFVMHLKIFPHHFFLHFYVYILMLHCLKWKIWKKLDKNMMHKTYKFRAIAAAAEALTNNTKILKWNYIDDTIQRMFCVFSVSYVCAYTCYIGKQKSVQSKIFFIQLSPCFWLARLLLYYVSICPMCIYFIKCWIFC